MSWIWLALSIGFEVSATLSLRASDGFRGKAWLVPVVGGYAAAFYFLSWTLAAGMPVAITYGLWTAVGIVAVALAARGIWNDPLTKRMVMGIGLIIIGVILVELG